MGTLGRAIYTVGKWIGGTGQAMDRLGSTFQGGLRAEEQVSRHRTIMSIFEKELRIQKDVFVAPSAAVIGDVEIGHGSSIWYGSILREALTGRAPPPSATAARRAVLVAVDAVSGGGIPILRCGGGSEVSVSGWSGGSRLRFARRFCTYDERDDRALEEEVEKKFGWMLKIFFLGTAGLVGWQFFPYMGDNLLQQSISLLHVKDPLFKRMGASRLARFAVDDERRMKVVEMGGAQEILNVLEGAKDDKTRKETLKALVALSKSDKAAGFLDEAGAYAISQFHSELP